MDARTLVYAAILVALAATARDQRAAAQTGPEPPIREKVAAALSAIAILERPGRDNLATIWDGNKYIQCRHMSDRSLRCEAAGSMMQVSLSHVLTPDRIGRLAALGWTLDPAFGNYVQTFRPDMQAAEMADKILAALAQGYDADLPNLEVETKSIRSEPCPPRNGPSQNLAGIINDAPAMARSAVHACAFRSAASEPAQKLGPGSTADDLITLYGPKVTAEIQRLRINMNRRVFAIFDTGLGYVQCEPQTEPKGFYCEAQSADSWPALAAVLTPERIAALHAAGFADPGRAPNYSKTYAADKIGDEALAREVLSLLHDVYGYYGASALAVKTEEGG